MNTKYFTESEMNSLSNNPYILSVSPTQIMYSDEFKRIFITASEIGESPRQIFIDNGFDVDLIGGSRIRKAAYRWRQAYKKDGVLGLDTRRGSSSRPPKKVLTLEEKVARMEAQIHLLKAENELLKKLDLLKRGMGKIE